MDANSQLGRFNVKRQQGPLQSISISENRLPISLDRAVDVNAERGSDPRPVLYVEDDEDDILFFRQAFAANHSEIPILHLSDGDAAWDYLSGSGATDRPNRPSLILLDLRLPGKSGFEILTRLKAHPELRRIPVVVLTSSGLSGDAQAAYDLGADFYVVKPMKLGTLRELARAIHAYWMAISGNPDALGADPTLGQLRRLAISSPSGKLSREEIGMSIG
jgi:CheY-like chemotaxis protein